MTTRHPQPISYDAIIVGAGFAGVYALHRLRGMGLSVHVFEAGEGIGGTWFHNRYPGARCDIESLDYSYSFDDELQQEWVWKERYAGQPEILSYINHVADRFDLRGDISLNTRISDVRYDEEEQLWHFRSENGAEYQARYAVMATGVLSVPQIPAMPGLESFKGPWYHSGDWPHGGVDFTGQRVGVIGTGSSGTQMIPIIADQAEELTVFQRTANFCMPAKNRPLDPQFQAEWKAEYPAKRANARTSSNGHNQSSNPLAGFEMSLLERDAERESRWELGGLYMMRAFRDMLTDDTVNAETSEWVGDRIREIVADPNRAELLVPKGLPFGTKRLCSGTDYYETFNRENVDLVDVRSTPIVEITENGVRTESGHYELDALVFATGFDAMTGALNALNPIGRGGVELREHWSAGPRTYLGIAAHGFPNMFVIAGPGSPSVFGNMVTSIEQHVEWIADAITYLRENNLTSLEASAESEANWIEHVNDLAQQTLYRDSRATWFYGANIPGKPVVFMPYIGGVGNYVSRITEVARSGYEGFETRSIAS